MSTTNIETATTGTSTSTPTQTTSPIIGRVKWFNNKAGYGFITVTDGPTAGTDIFAHHSSITVSSEQYKYLVQGEYIQFTVITSEGTAHAVQAGNVSGINGGKLMCETRNEFKQTKHFDNADNAPTSAPQLKRTNSVTESTPRGPREGQSWSMANTGSGSGRGGRGTGLTQGGRGGRGQGGRTSRAPTATFDA